MILPPGFPVNPCSTIKTKMAGVNSAETLVVLPGKPEQSEATMKLQNVCGTGVVALRYSQLTGLPDREARFPHCGALEYPRVTAYHSD